MYNFKVGERHYFIDDSGRVAERTSNTEDREYLADTQNS